MLLFIKEIKNKKQNFVRKNVLFMLEIYSFIRKMLLLLRVLFLEKFWYGIFKEKLLGWKDILVLSLIWNLFKEIKNLRLLPLLMIGRWGCGVLIWKVRVIVKFMNFMDTVHGFGQHVKLKVILHQYQKMQLVNFGNYVLHKMIYRLFKHWKVI